MAIQPTEDRVLVRIEKQEEKNEMGLIIPDTAKEKEQEGVVVAVGPGRLIDGKYVELNIKPGDKVFFGRQQGVEIKDNGETLYLFGANSIWAVIKD